LSEYYGEAVGITAVLKEGNAPIIVKADKVLVGNLSSGAATQPLSFTIEVNEDADPGIYQMMLEMTYKELSNPRSGTETELEWTNKSVNKELNIEIKEESKAVEITGDLDAAIVGSVDFIPGKTTTVPISIQNNNTVTQKDPAVIKEVSDYYGSAVSLTATLKQGDAPITIKTEKVLLGTVPIGVAIPPVPFTVTVKENAKPGLYQMVLELTYKELSQTEIGIRGLEGAGVSSDVISLEWVDKTVNNIMVIEIKDEPVEFEFESVEATLHPGVQKEISLTFKNKGSQAASYCEAKISVFDPLSPTDDTAFLGDMNAGETAVGVFGLKVKVDAIPKDYALEAQIKYTDQAGEEQVSKVLIVPIRVSSGASPTFDTIKEYLPGGLVGAGIVAVIWIIWFILSRVKPIIVE
jgi:hypothetical protein